MFAYDQNKKRPLWVRFFRFIGYLLILILSPLVFVCGDIISRVIFYEGQSLQVVSLVLFVISVSLSLPLAYLLLIHRFKKRFITFFHYTFQAVLIGSLFMTNSLLLNFSQNDKYHYQFGNCSATLGSLLRTSGGQRFYREILDLFPLTTQYGVYSFENACKAATLRADFSEVYPNYCTRGEGYNCFRKVLNEIDNNAPMSPTGITLAIAVGSLRIYKDRALSDELSEDLKRDALIKSTLSLIDLALWGISASQNTYVINDIAGKEIASKYASLSIEEKGYYEIVIQNLFLDVSGKAFRSAYNMLTGASLSSLPDDVERDMASYSYLRSIDRKIAEKFVNISTTKIDEMLKEVEKELKSKDISHEKKELYKSRVESYKQELSVLVPERV